MLTPLPGLPEVVAGADLAELIDGAARRARLALDGGALVVCQKIVSKAEDRVVSLVDVRPSAMAERIALEDGKDARVVELVLRETARIVRRGHGVMICETHHGFVCANAGVDLSNAPGPDTAILLPRDPDASAAALRRALQARGAGAPAVIVSDTFGRPWREGLVDVAIGCAGIAPIDDQRGSRDRGGRELQVTTPATADQLAAAAGLLMRKADGIPVVLVRGVPIAGDGTVRETLRRSGEDLFR